MLPSPARKYLIAGLAGTSEVLDHLLKGIPASEAVWNFRPDPDRFTLREIVAHLADWEPIFAGRMHRTIEENEPFLEDIDEGQMASDHDYAHSDPHQSLARIREARPKLIVFLRTVHEEAWDRSAQRDTIGRITLEGQAVLMLGHDGYHLQQITQWLHMFSHPSS